jgi:hypothetical protein
MPYEIREVEFNEKCLYCNESMKGFVVFGRHTPRKTGGDVCFTEYIYKKRTEGDAEILSLLVTGQCQTCNVTNIFKCEYNLETNSYKVEEINF